MSTTTAAGSGPSSASRARSDSRTRIPTACSRSWSDASMHDALASPPTPSCPRRISFQTAEPIRGSSETRSSISSSPEHGSSTLTTGESDSPSCHADARIAASASSLRCLSSRWSPADAANPRSPPSALSSSRHTDSSATTANRAANQRRSLHLLPANACRTTRDADLRITPHIALSPFGARHYHARGGFPAFLLFSSELKRPRRGSPTGRVGRTPPQTGGCARASSSSRTIARNSAGANGFGMKR